MDKKFVMIILVVAILVMAIAFFLLVNPPNTNIKYGSATLSVPSINATVKNTSVETNTQTILKEAQKQDIINALRPELKDYIDTETESLRAELKGYTDQSFNDAKAFATSLATNNVQRDVLNCQVAQPEANGQNTGNAICARLNDQSATNNWACTGTIKHDKFNTFSDAGCLNMKGSSDVTDLYSCSEQQLSRSETACVSIGNNTWRKIRSQDAAICCQIL
jgi:hypothetical protein